MLFLISNLYDYHVFLRMWTASRLVFRKLLSSRLRIEWLHNVEYAYKTYNENYCQTHVLLKYYYSAKLRIESPVIAPKLEVPFPTYRGVQLADARVATSDSGKLKMNTGKHTFSGCSSASCSCCAAASASWAA